MEHGKPDPRLVGLAVRKLGLPASQSVMIGDTPYDAEAALGAGAAAAGVLTGGFAPEALMESVCFAVAEELRVLLLALESDGPGETSKKRTGAQASPLHRRSAQRS